VAQCYQLLGLDPTYTEQDLVLVLGEIETAARRTRIYLDSGTVLIRDPAAEDTAPQPRRTAA